MAKPVTISLESSDDHGGNAPVVLGFLHQVEDVVRMLQSVESTLADHPDDKLVWRVTGMSKRSRCRFELTPFPGTQGTAKSAARQAKRVIHLLADSLHAIASDGETDMEFPEEALKYATRICNRVGKGLESTKLDFSEYLVEAFRTFTVNRQNVAEYAKSIRRARQAAPRGHHELGSVEGFVTEVGHDTGGQPILRLRSRLDETSVKCLLSEKSLEELGACRVDDIMRGSVRIEVYGLITMNERDQIKQVQVEEIDVFDPEEDLPSAAEMVTPNYTGGLDAVTFLAEIRGNE